VILAGDVGGTKTQLGIFERDGDRWRERRAMRVESRAFPSLPALVRTFLDEGTDGPITHVAFGVAGPVVDGRCEATNLSWVIDSRDFAPLFADLPVVLVNDLVATAAGVLDLTTEQLATVHEGVERHTGTRAVLAPGTGLGEAMLFWDGERYHAVPSEGGHGDWAPRDEEEVAFFEWLRARHGRVSCERALSGPSISAIYEFLRDTGRASEPASLASTLDRAEDRNAAITEAALGDVAPIARHALDRWIAILGAEAGNLALRAVAAGGVYLAGGFVPRLVSALRAEQFTRAFTDKPPLDDLLRTIPVRVVLETKTAYFGAARLALAGGPDRL
jgi:glucokinase